MELEQLPLLRRTLRGALLAWLTLKWQDVIHSVPVLWFLSFPFQSIKRERNDGGRWAFWETSPILILLPSQASMVQAPLSAISLDKVILCQHVLMKPAWGHLDWELHSVNHCILYQLMLDLEKFMASVFEKFS